MGTQNLPDLLGWNFVGSKFTIILIILNKCFIFICGDVNSCARATHKSHEHRPLANNDNFTVPVLLVLRFHSLLPQNVLTVCNQLHVLISQDVAALQGKITNLKGSYEVKAWNHLDFIWGVDAATVVYKPIIELIIKDLKTNG